MRQREANADCDFFVGKTHFGVTNTEHAIAAVKEALGASAVAQQELKPDAA